MSKTIALSELDTYLQDRLVTTVGVALDQTQRVRAMNQTIQMLQGAANWSTTKRNLEWDYLEDETDYSVANDLGLSDFKDVYDIRDPNRAHEIFEGIDERLFAEYEREGRTPRVYTVEERDNTDILRVIYTSGNTRSQIAALDSLTEDGIWASDTSGSDATTLSADATRFKIGGGSLKFNIDVSQSSNNYAAIRNTTLTSVDISDFENIGFWRSWLDLRQLTAAQLATISSVEIRFGSNASSYSTNYTAITVSAPITGASWRAGWNRVSWDWKNATTTGTVDLTAVVYAELRINYSSAMTDANNVRWDDLVLIEPREMEMTYFSQFFVIISGTQQLEFTTSTVNTSESLLLPSAHRDNFIALVAKYGFAMLKHEDSPERIISRLESDQAFRRLFTDLGSKIVRETKSISVRGFSSGRINGDRLMW